MLFSQVTKSTVKVMSIHCSELHTFNLMLRLGLRLSIVRLQYKCSRWLSCTLNALDWPQLCQTTQLSQRRVVGQFQPDLCFMFAFFPNKTPFHTALGIVV